MIVSSKQVSWYDKRYFNDRKKRLSLIMISWYCPRLAEFDRTIIDLQNLKIEGRLTETHPKQRLPNLETLTISSNFEEDSPKKEPCNDIFEFCCPNCNRSGFSSAGYMKQHMKLKHQEQMVDSASGNSHSCPVKGCSKKPKNRCGLTRQFILITN